jgi:hypothetical protein
MTGRAELLGKRGEWLLDVVVDGRTFRFSTSPVEVITADGDVLSYRDGLRDLEESVALDGSADLAVAVTIDASDAWDELVAAFAGIERSPATLRRWFDGQLFEQARVHLDGQVDGFAYGDRLEPVSFQVLRRARVQSRRLPTPAMVVDDATWPVRPGYSIDTRRRGAYYPIVIGAPGTGSGSPAPATEGLFVEHGGGATPRLLVAGHRVRATQVRVYDFTDDGTPVATTLGVETMQDLTGRTISYVNMGAFGGTVDIGRDYYIGWSVADGGGYVSPTTGGLLRGGGDIIEWALRTFTDIQLDAARFAGSRHRLNSYLFDTFINEPIDPLDWLQSEVLPVLPVEPRQGERGLYYFVRRWDATAADAVARLDADLRHVQRESDIESRSEELVNEVAVQYGPNRQSGLFRSRDVVGAFGGRRGLEDEFEPGLVEEDPRFLGSYRAALSQRRYGRQPLVVELNSVWDTATAVRHAQDIIAAQALPRRFVTYSAQTEYESLEPGDVVILNDSSVRIIDAIALVVDVVVGGPEVVLELEILDDPAQAQRG